MDDQNVNSDARAARLRGFTIIEILVVISIIVILMAMVIAVGIGVKSHAQRAQTKAAMQTLVALYNSYTQETGGATAPSASNTSFDSLAAVNQLVTNAIQMPQFKKSLSALPGSTLQQNGGTYQINDGFGSPIGLGPPTWVNSTTYSVGAYVVKSGICYQSLQNGNLNNAPPSASWTTLSGLPPRYPFFQSAGPDGIMGTADDIYSYDP